MRARDSRAQLLPSVTGVVDRGGGRQARKGLSAAPARFPSRIPRGAIHSAAQLGMTLGRKPELSRKSPTTLGKEPKSPASHVLRTGR